MFKQLRRLFIGGLVIGAFSASVLSVTTPTPVSAACGQFLTFPAWYEGLTKGDCKIKEPKEIGGDKDTQLTRYTSRIVLNVVETLLQLVVYIAVGFIIYGGFIYLTSNGREQKITEGRQLILNAVIGLVIAMFAVLVISFVGDSITK